MYLAKERENDTVILMQPEELRPFSIIFAQLCLHYPNSQILCT